MGGQKVGVFAQVRVGGGQALSVVVGRGCGRAFGVFHQRPLQLVGDNAQLVAAHVDEHIHAGLDAHLVGGGNELAIGGQAHLAGVGNNPLGIGGGEVDGPARRRAFPAGRYR